MFYLPKLEGGGGGGRTAFFAVVILVAVSLFNGMGYGTKQKNYFPAELGSFSPSKENNTNKSDILCRQQWQSEIWVDERKRER
jgi:hypothetical protein